MFLSHIDWIQAHNSPYTFSFVKNIRNNVVFLPLHSNAFCVGLSYKIPGKYTEGCSCSEKAWLLLQGTAAKLWVQIPNWFCWLLNKTNKKLTSFTSETLELWNCWQVFQAKQTCCFCRENSCWVLCAALCAENSHYLFTDVIQVLRMQKLLCQSFLFMFACCLL